MVILMIKQEIETTVYPDSDGFGKAIAPESWIGRKVLIQLLPEEPKSKQCGICHIIFPIEEWKEFGGVCKNCNDHMNKEGF